MAKHVCYYWLITIRNWGNNCDSADEEEKMTQEHQDNKNQEKQTKPIDGMELFRDKNGNYITSDSFWAVGPRDFEY